MTNKLKQDQLSINNLYPPFTAPPALASWAWRNQETATAQEYQNKIYMTTPAVAGDKWRILEKAIPSAPYTITAAFLSNMIAANYSQAGFILTNSSDGKIISYNISSNGTAIGIAFCKWNSVTSFNAAYIDAPIRALGGGLLYLRFVDDGTNRAVYFSHDGITFILVKGAVGRTDFCTPDKFGWGININNATYGGGITLVSWKEE